MGLRSDTHRCRALVYGVERSSYQPNVAPFVCMSARVFHTIHKHRASSLLARALAGRGDCCEYARTETRQGLGRVVFSRPGTT